ncbi:MAG: TetR/AcrR family transcriptional regulator [Chloroflexi bacterium]|nr:TetR/AcrR family transcriptional regulator [Chloroflexota bacterium]
MEESIPRSERASTQIVQAAYRLFLQNGYHGASMRQVAQEAGVALGGIYNHFPNKEALFREVLFEYHPYKNVVPYLLEAQGDTLEAILRDAARRLVAGLGERRDLLNLLFIEMVEFNGQHMGDLFELIYPHVALFAQQFVQRQDELRPIPIIILLRSFLGLFFSYFITEIMIAEKFPPEGRENALDYFVDIYLHGILKDTPPAEAA